jgi:hypothetical protein
MRENPRRLVVAGICRGAAGDYFRCIHDGPGRDESYEAWMEDTLERYRTAAVLDIVERFEVSEGEATQMLDAVDPTEALEWL